MTEKFVPVVIVVDDNLVDLRHVETDLLSMGLVQARVVLCPTIEYAIAALQHEDPLVVLLDDNLGPASKAEDSIPRLRQAGCTAAKVVMSSSITERRYDALMALGCFEVVEKDELGPDSLEMLLVTLHHVQRAEDRRLGNS
jgi:CheY-like chemotaxis protein